MASRIPAEQAFQYYLGLGPDRSLARVAEYVGATKRGVSKLARRERWAERVARIEEEARERSDSQAADALAEMDARHLKIAKSLQGKALKALMEKPLEAPRDVIRALEVGVRTERLIRGEPTERGEVSVEEITKKEMRRWMEVVDEPEDGADAGDAPDQEASDLR